MIKNCLICDREFYTKPARVKTGRGKYCSRECAKRTLFKKNQISWNKGRKYLQIEGVNHFRWKGDQVGINALHSWIKRQKEKINICKYCLKKCKTQWANVSHEYKRELTDFMELCPSCHKKYDLAYRLDIKYTYYIWLGLVHLIHLGEPQHKGLLF